MPGRLRCGEPTPQGSPASSPVSRGEARLASDGARESFSPIPCHGQVRVTSFSVSSAEFVPGYPRGWSGSTTGARNQLVNPFYSSWMRRRRRSFASGTDSPIVRMSLQHRAHAAAGAPGTRFTRGSCRHSLPLDSRGGWIKIGPVLKGAECIGWARHWRSIRSSVGSVLSDCPSSSGE